MRDMPFRLEAAPVSLRITSVEAVCNVAVVGTVFPGALFADAENLSTMTADNLASVPMVDQFGMGVPPFGSAGIRAEHLGFSSRSLNQGCAAALTHLFHTARVLGSNYATQGISLAVGSRFLRYSRTAPLSEQSFYSHIPADGKLSAPFFHQWSCDFLQSEEGCSSVPNGNEERVLAGYR